MSVLLDCILVIDLEATCWRGQPPLGEEREIIEIGLSPLDLKQRQPLTKESILVRPTRSQVSAFCTELTTLTQAQVDAGVSFREACNYLRSQHQSYRRMWASYGEYDRHKFVKQCKAFSVKYPFSDRHLNVKTLVAMVLGLRHEVGMAQALELLEIPLEGTHHRGHDDAFNVAKILARILWQQSTVVTQLK
ncbi:MAG: 3'-5' exonuclease [Jaaginema sp. PMC 1079.18]|nr:3'-5' exonuclease [Jaaginema sp. PMC 1080.18]MEC4850138.1 3'-5' exonuclease [Jaaginema sp. PMC 1079.18]MEC4866344.1 3'-5' exonuclease [Jaaginema sp. PMC 1078.18]